MQICSKNQQYCFKKKSDQNHNFTKALLDFYESFYIKGGISLHALAIFIVVPKKRARHLGLI